MRGRALAPVVAALAAWGVGTAAILRHVLLADDFVSSEIRRHGVLPQLLTSLAELAVPYLVVGIGAAWVARGIAKTSGDPLTRRARWEGAVGVALVVATLAAAVVYTIVDRPATMAGILWRRGGAWRALQVALTERLSSALVGWSATIAAALLISFGAYGWWRGATRERRRVGLATMASVVVFLAAAAVVPRAFRAVRKPKTAAGTPNVLVIVVDSLRPDRALDPKVAPHMAELAARSVRFTDARTPCALTYPSIASILTGKQPAQHGVRHHYPEEALRTLGSATLPRALAARGYETIAVGGYCSTPLRELDAGFAVQRTPRSELDLIVSAVAFRGHPWLPAALHAPWMRRFLPQLRAAVEGSHPRDVAMEAATAWRRTRRPFFELVFFDNPHAPYVPVWPDAGGRGDYAGPNRYTLLQGDLVEQIRVGESGEGLRESEVESANARALYDDAVRSVDRAVGSLLAALRRDGHDDDTLVVLVADHGENLLDGGGALTHGEALERDRSNAVPWTIAWKGRLMPRDVVRPVLLTDLAPTVVALVGGPPLDGADGISRAPEARGEAGSPERPALLETGMWFVARETVDRLDPTGRGLAYPSLDKGLLTMEPGRPQHVVVAPGHRAELVRAKQRRLEWGPWALTYKPRTTGAAFALYRRDSDPVLTRDVSSENRDMLKTMVAMLYAEAARQGETELVPPEDPALTPGGAR